MQPLHSIETSRLMDLLSRYTIAYMELLTDGSSQEEYLKCKEAIKAIQLEIELRQHEETVAQPVNDHVITIADFS